MLYSFLHRLDMWIAWTRDDDGTEVEENYETRQTATSGSLSLVCRKGSQFDSRTRTLEWKRRIENVPRSTVEWMDRSFYPRSAFLSPTDFSACDALFKSRADTK